MIRTILVDDEEMAIHRLKQALQGYPDILVTGEAMDGPAAVQLINSQWPDLVFLDIQMPGLSGLDVLRQLTCQPLIVFVTAYEEYAVKAFELHSLDYLLKPVEQERLAMTLKRVRENREKRMDQSELLEKLKTLLQQQPVATKAITTIPVKTGNKIQLVSVQDICFLQADDKYVNLHTQKEVKLIEYPLNYLLERLPPEFIRIHRSYIVNKNKIREIHKDGKGSFTLVMNDTKGTALKSAQSYSDTIREKLFI